MTNDTDYTNDIIPAGDMPAMPPHSSAPVVIVDKDSYEALVAELAQRTATADMLFDRAQQYSARITQLEAQLAANAQGATRYVPLEDGDWFWSEMDKTVLDISNGGKTIAIDDGENRLSKTFNDNVHICLCRRLPAGEGGGRDA